MHVGLELDRLADGKTLLLSGTSKTLAAFRTCSGSAMAPAWAEVVVSATGTAPSSAAPRTPTTRR